MELLKIIWNGDILSNYISSFANGAAVDAELTKVANSNLSATHKITRSATLVIAASDSSAKSKAQADYVCDGTADETDFASAFIEVGSAGGRIRLLDGTYVIDTGDLNLVSNIVLEGQGISTVIKYNTKRMNITGKSNICIKNLKIDATDLGERNGLAVSANCNNILFKNIYIYNQPTSSIFLTSALSSNITYDNIIFDNVVAPMQCSDAVNIVYKNCRSSDNSIIPLIAINGYNKIQIYNNTVLNRPLVKVQNTGGRRGDHLNIIGNMIHGYHDNYGIIVVNGSDGIVNNNLVISNNNITAGETTGSLSYNAIAVYGRATNWTVANNVIDQSLNRHNGIGISNASLGVVIGNTVYGCTESGESGIEVEANPIHGGLPGHSERVLVVGNYVHNCNSGIHCRTMDPEHPGWGGLVQIPENVCINDNYIYSCDTGIEVLTGDEICINNNYLDANTSDIFIDTNVTNCTVDHNHGYVTENIGTATITTGQTSINVSHGLAAAPTRVILTPTTALGGKFAYVSAKAASTFTITIDSAHSADISFDWYAVV